jgi:hypothetical protein
MAQHTIDLSDDQEAALAARTADYNLRRAQAGQAPLTPAQHLVQFVTMDWLDVEVRRRADERRAFDGVVRRVSERLSREDRQALQSILERAEPVTDRSDRG